MVTGTLDMKATQYALTGSYNTETGNLAVSIVDTEEVHLEISGVVEDGGGMTTWTAIGVLGRPNMEDDLEGLREGTFHGTVSGSTVTVTGAQYEGGTLYSPDGSREVLAVVTGTGTFEANDPDEWDFRLNVHVEASIWSATNEQIDGYADDALVPGETVE